MKVLTCSRQFPKGHPKAGQHTNFVEKIWACPEVNILNADLLKEDILNFQRNEYLYLPKWHTIRAGNRWKAGDMASLRVWSDKPYRSKQIEFVQVEIKKTWEFVLRPVKSNGEILIKGFLNGQLIETNLAEKIAKNDGLNITEFQHWFCPVGTKFILILPIFSGQIICWSDKINYQ